MAAIILYNVFKLLRYISEIWQTNPRNPSLTKGGYMEGKIKIPRAKGKLRMEIQTVPADDVDPMIAEIHPCLLHVIRIEKGKRQQHLEPMPNQYHWKQIFEIEDGKVRILNRLSDCETRNGNVPEVDDVTRVQGDSIILGAKNGMLNLILLQPYQTQSKKSDTTIYKVLEDRLHHATRENIKLIEKQFIKNPKNLKRIRLKVDFYTENGQNCGSAFSPVIMDSKDKNVGAIDLYDATPLISCVNGGRKIMMISEFELAHDVYPTFQVYDNNGLHRPKMDLLLTQPKNIKIKHRTIIFLSPPQTNFQNIQSTLGKFKIKLVGKRKWDGHISIKKFDFGFEDHMFNNCVFCESNVDSDYPICIEPDLNRAGPGKIRRRKNDSDSDLSESFSSSNNENDKDLMEVTNMDDNDRNDITEINVEDFNHINNDDVTKLLSGFTDVQNPMMSDRSNQCESDINCLLFSELTNVPERRLMYQQHDKQPMLSTTTGTSITENSKMEFTNISEKSEGNLLSVDNNILNGLLFSEDEYDIANMGVTEANKYANDINGLNIPPYCHTTTNGIRALNDPMMADVIGSNQTEYTTRIAEKHFIFKDGGIIVEDDKVVFDSTAQNKEIAKKTESVNQNRKMKKKKAERCWLWLTDFGEKYVLANVPFLSFSFMVFTIIFKGLSAFTEELQVGFIPFNPLALSLLFIYLRIILTNFKSTNVCIYQTIKKEKKKK